MKRVTVELQYNDKVYVYPKDGDEDIRIVVEDTEGVMALYATPEQVRELAVALLEAAGMERGYFTTRHYLR